MTNSVTFYIRLSVDFVGREIENVIVFDSKFPVTLVTVHNPILFCSTRKSNLILYEYEAQDLLTNILLLQTIHTTSSNLALTDVLKRRFL